MECTLSTYLAPGLFVMLPSDSICALFHSWLALSDQWWFASLKKRRRKRNNFRVPKRKKSIAFLRVGARFWDHRLREEWKERVYIPTVNWLWGWERDLCLALINGRNWTQLEFAGQMVFSNLKFCSVFWEFSCSSVDPGLQGRISRVFGGDIEGDTVLQR